MYQNWARMNSSGNPQSATRTPPRAQAGGGRALGISPRIHFAQLKTRSTFPSAPTTCLYASKDEVVYTPVSGVCSIKVAARPELPAILIHLIRRLPGAPGKVLRACPDEEGRAEDDSPVRHPRQPQQQHANRVEHACRRLHRGPHLPWHRLCVAPVAVCHHCCWVPLYRLVCLWSSDTAKRSGVFLGLPRSWVEGPQVALH